jgi:hypothetical protein
MRLGAGDIQAEPEPQWRAAPQRGAVIRQPRGPSYPLQGAFLIAVGPDSHTLTVRRNSPMAQELLRRLHAASIDAFRSARLDQALDRGRMLPWRR